jgi:hypothetical protein
LQRAFRPKDVAHLVALRAQKKNQLVFHDAGMSLVLSPADVDGMTQDELSTHAILASVPDRFEMSFAEKANFVLSMIQEEGITLIEGVVFPSDTEAYKDASVALYDEVYLFLPEKYPEVDEEGSLIETTHKGIQSLQQKKLRRFHDVVRLIVFKLHWQLLDVKLNFGLNLFTPLPAPR